MTENAETIRRLKALRERAGLSIRALAHELGMSSSGYAHYETPERFKDAYLPVDVAQRLGPVLQRHGVPAEDVYALTGAPSLGAAPDRDPAPGGLREEATPFTLRETAVPPDAPHRALRAIFGATARHPSTFMAETAAPAFDISAGDVLVCDMSRPPQPGELALIRRYDDQLGAAVSAVRKYFPPWLVSGTSPAAPPLREDDPTITIRHPVIGLIRGAAG